jgi:hypothetical protein
MLRYLGPQTPTRNRTWRRQSLIYVRLGEANPRILKRVQRNFGVRNAVVFLGW